MSFHFFAIRCSAHLVSIASKAQAFKAQPMASTKPRKKPKPRRSQRRLQPETQGQTHRLSAKTSLVWTGVIFLLHTLGLAVLFVPMTGLFNSQPVIEQDWGLHFHHLKSMEAFWSQDGRLWGYNPLFMAGYPSNTIQDLSIKLFEVLALLLSVLGLDVTQETPRAQGRLCRRHGTSAS